MFSSLGSRTTGTKAGRGFWSWAGASFDMGGRDVRSLGKELREKWGCVPWDSGQRGGYRFLPLAELRAKFEAVHGKQEWTNKAQAWPVRGHDTGGNNDKIPF